MGGATKERGVLFRVSELSGGAALSDILLRISERSGFGKGFPGREREAGAAAGRRKGRMGPGGVRERAEGDGTTPGPLPAGKKNRRGARYFLAPGAAFG